MLAPIIWILPGGPVNRRQGAGSGWSPTRDADILEGRFLEIAAIRWPLWFERHLSAWSLDALETGRCAADPAVGVRAANSR